jgi:hypothetical protein
MKSRFLRKKFNSRHIIWIGLVVSAIFFFGCQSKPAPLSPAAVTFKKEIKDCFANLSPTLMEPVAKKDVAAINAALEKVESPAVKLCRLCPFQLGVLNQFGEALTTYPIKSANNGKNFSNYDLVTKTINTKKIQRQRFFLQNGSELYMVCAPLIREGKVIGLVVIAVDSENAEKRWGLKEKEFLALDFNT